MERIVQHDEQADGGAFFIDEDEKRIAEMTYRRINASLVIINHTEVAPSLRGQGVARLLLDAAVQWARASRTGMRSSCSYVSAQFARDASIGDVQH